ncbi:MAG: hypothetical protein HND48_15265 [Chloroflexi bacterium]|nr:hypothetical protein [Chloroflexota bacterium]
MIPRAPNTTITPRISQYHIGIRARSDQAERHGRYEQHEQRVVDGRGGEDQQDASTQRGREPVSITWGFVGAGIGRQHRLDEQVDQPRRGQHGQTQAARLADLRDEHHGEGGERGHDGDVRPLHEDNEDQCEHRPSAQRQHDRRRGAAAAARLCPVRGAECDASPPTSDISAPMLRTVSATPATAADNPIARSSGVLPISVNATNAITAASAAGATYLSVSRAENSRVSVIRAS